MTCPASRVTCGDRAVSSAGRALRLQRRGRRFEPVTAHQNTASRARRLGVRDRARTNPGKNCLSTAWDESRRAVRHCDVVGASREDEDRSLTGRSEERFVSRPDLRQEWPVPSDLIGRCFTGIDREVLTSQFDTRAWIGLQVHGPRVGSLRRGPNVANHERGSVPQIEQRDGAFFTRLPSGRRKK